MADNNVIEMNNAKAMSASASAISKSIKSIRTRSTKLQTDIHDCAVACLTHAMTFSDARPAKALYDALPKSQRREALYEWIQKYSPVRWNNKTGKCGLLKETAKTYNPFDIETATANPYWNLEERALMHTGNFDMETVLNREYRKLRSQEMAIKEFPDLIEVDEGFNIEAELKKCLVMAEVLDIELTEPTEESLRKKLEKRAA